MQVANTLTDTPTGRLSDRVVEAVRVEMARRRITQARLADLTGLTQQYISRRMTGAAPFDVEDLDKIAAALGVPVADFFPAATRAAA